MKSNNAVMHIRGIKAESTVGTPAVSETEGIIYVSDYFCDVIRHICIYILFIT
jgi:hypothetical protein